MFIDEYLDDIIYDIKFLIEQLSAYIFHEISIDVEEVLLGHTTFVELSNVSKWIYTGEKDVWSWWDSKIFPCLSPPWPFSWFEFTVPTISIANELVKNYFSRVKRVGAFSLGLSKKDHGKLFRRISRIGLWSHQLEVEGRLVHMDDSLINWVVIHIIFLKSMKFKEGYSCAGIYNSYLDDQGQELFATKRVSEFDHLPVVKPAPTLAGFDDGEDVNNLIFFTTILPSLFGVSLLHCKNVEAVERKSEVRINKYREKKGKRPLMKFKTLEIDAARKILKYEGKSDKVGLRRALHICRGHFRDCREGRGLFGRHKGVYWVPMHTRGDKKVGIIEKDYKIGKIKK